MSPEIPWPQVAGWLSATAAASISALYRSSFFNFDTCPICSRQLYHAGVPKDLAEPPGNQIGGQPVFLHKSLLVVHLADPPAVSDFSISVYIDSATGNKEIFAYNYCFYYHISIAWHFRDQVFK